MRNWLNNYFGFTKREYNALLILIVLIGVLKVFPYVYAYFKPAEDETDALSAVQELTLADRQGAYPSAGSGASSVEKSARLFKFDPNKISFEQWKELGLSARQAQAIMNYRTKGGKFYKAEDLKKMYTLPAPLYERLRPFVEIDDPPVKLYNRYDSQEGKSAKGGQKIFSLIEINSADSVKLEEIKGVGPVFARRIARYRDRLGGFYKKEQLLEVYGLDSVRYHLIKDQVLAEPGLVKKININTAVFDDLKFHPYLTYKQINVILQYRKQHGSYSGIQDLRKVLVLSPQVIERIAPYIIFDIQ